MTPKVKTKPPRAALPAISRFSTAVFSGLARRTKFVDPALAERWRTLVGDELAALSRPGRLTGGKTGRTLEVMAPSAAAAARLNFEAETIRRGVNTFLGPDTVGRIAVLVRTPEPERRNETDLRDQTPTSAGSPALEPVLSRFRASVKKRQS
ncbi:MAG: DciA family protein [Pseudomonadota bacterium]